MNKLHCGLYFKTASSRSELHDCYHLRYQVYCEEKRWISEDDFPDKMERDMYDDKAIHVVAYNDDSEIVGLMRILRKQDYEFLPYQKHPGMLDKEFMASNVAELSRFVVTASKNRADVTRGLIRAVYHKSKQLGIENWVLVNEPSLIRLLGMFSFIFEPLCQPVNYFGGFTQVALGNISRSEDMWKKKKPEMAEFYHYNPSLNLAAMAG